MLVLTGGDNNNYYYQCAVLELVYSRVWRIIDGRVVGGVVCACRWCVCGGGRSQRIDIFLLIEKIVSR